MAPLSSSNRLRHQVQLWAVGKPALPALPTYDVDSPKTSAFLATGAQNTPNYYISEPSYPSARPVIPTRIISSVISDQANQILLTYPPSSRRYLGLPNTSFPPETSQTHTLLPHFINLATREPPEVVSQSFGGLRPCKWQDNQGSICGELAGRNCQHHLR
ncbi:hypothetical protein EDC04DRAFT_2741253 [Pisolithus marmoratus]|nr:hypothetical protein EDC04DRAFT_2741253 [Pisolithus marmoratus]